VSRSPSGPRKLFKGMTTATSGVLARFPLLLPVRNSFVSYGASAVARTSDRGHVAQAKKPKSSKRGLNPGFQRLWTFWTLEELFRGNGVTLRTQKVIQGGDNGHVGRPCQVSPAPPCPELFCELRGLCRRSYFGPRTFGRSEKPRSSKWRSLNPGFQRNLSPP
jgi:hypothetical protein